MESDQSSNPQTGRTTWTPPMDRLFIGLMEDQVQKGQLLDGQFSKYAWTHFVDNFKQSFGSSFTKDVLKNRMKTLKKNYVAVSTLRGQSGFGWDQSREIVIADDAVWDDYIKKHPDVKCWRTKTLAHFDELVIIFGDNRANGRYNRCRNDNTVQDDDDHDNENLDNTQSPDTPQEQNENGYKYKDEDLRTSDTQKRDRASTGLNSRPFRKTKKSTGEGMVDAIQVMAAAVNNVATKKEENKISSSLEASLVSALEDVPNLDDDTFVQALDLLEDEKKAKIFIALIGNRKRQWLLSKLNISAYYPSNLSD
ncbi:hypothetical protein C5167_007385 [Papaver somniferum]|uniref:L10-interacting MYB domain-containing protein-like n=1 Tax=Papaver somniferum TaxID=3469 RepID=UPI000E6F962B|nr:L10-interacting MYB domain-containing protein-like [Papaver somniferum]RZC86201.1 hypothetical protein C5167_007385 [Papaver somniferum]